VFSQHKRVGRVVSDYGSQIAAIGIAVTLLASVNA
jgi:hypothetical protein